MDILKNVSLCLILFVLSTRIVSSTNKFAAYIHFRYSLITDKPDFFSLRRLALYNRSQIGEKIGVSFRLLYKTGNESSSDGQIYLQHAYLDVQFSPSICLKIGQFKPPFGKERFVPDYEILGVERSLVTDKLIPNGSLGASFARDYGIQVHNNFDKALFSYELAIMTGNGSNSSLTTRNAPLLVARISKKIKSCVIPWLKIPFELLIQVAYSYRHAKGINLLKQIQGCNQEVFENFQGNDQRLNAVTNLKIMKTELTIEYIYTSLNSVRVSTSTLYAQGFYGSISHMVNPNVQIFLKYETYDPDISIASFHDSAWFTVGINYYLNNDKNRLMLNYIHKNEKVDAFKNDMIVLQLQYFLFGR